MISPKTPRVIAATAALVLLVACSSKVPDLHGMTQQQAQDALAKVKMKVGHVATGQGQGAPGTVIDQDPKAAAKLPSDGAVALVLLPGNPQGNPQGSSSDGGSVAVPSVIGQTLEQADAALANAGLLRGRVDVNVVNQPAGQVYDQDPQTPTSVPQGSAVDLKIASDAMVTVPRLAGQSQAAAQSTLQSAGLAMGDVSYDINPAPAAPGTVVSSNPDANISVARGTLVKLVVKEDTTTVPRVVGMTSDQAQLKIFQAGLQPVINLVLDKAHPAGTVMSQSVPDGTTVAKNSSVGIRVTTLWQVRYPIQVALQPGVLKAITTVEQANRVSSK